VSTIGLFHDLVGNAPLIQKARKLVDHVAKSDANVLVLGGSGTGKEIAARCIHNRSSRKNKPFVPINCGAIPSELLESELFGHEKGAFTGALSARKGRFELANQGTLFLDEIGDMPLNMQVKLLRVLQEQSFERIGCNKTIKVNVRIIAATHHDLEALIKDGKFREDLYYRLNVFPIKMPALKDRSEDILLLINELSYRMKENNIPVAKFMPDSVSLLKNYPWPGNVRELANLVERLSIIYPNGIIGENELPKRFKKHCGDLNTVKVVKSSEPEPVACDNTIQVEEDFIRGIDLKKHLVETELTLITQALDETNWVVAKAANYLNMRRTTLVEKMKKYGISRPTKAC
jgi:sigma-54 specific flagellar transcriptional regulator A